MEGGLEALKPSGHWFCRHPLGRPAIIRLGLLQSSTWPTSSSLGSAAWLQRRRCANRHPSRCRHPTRARGDQAPLGSTRAIGSYRRHLQDACGRRASGRAHDRRGDRQQLRRSAPAAVHLRGTASVDSIVAIARGCEPHRSFTWSPQPSLLLPFRLVPNSSGTTSTPSARC